MPTTFDQANLSKAALAHPRRKAQRGLVAAGALLPTSRSSTVPSPTAFLNNPLTLSSASFSRPVVRYPVWAKEAILLTQALAPQAMFIDLARRAARSESPSGISLRVALKARNHCLNDARVLGNGQTPTGRVRARRSIVQSQRAGVDRAVRVAVQTHMSAEPLPCPARPASRK